LIQLKRCNEMAERRRLIAARYNEAFSNLGAIETPTILHDRESAWHLYVLRLNLEVLSIDRAEFVEELKNLGISVSVHFIPLHLQPYYRQTYGYKRGDLPMAEKQYERYLSLPLFSGMLLEEIDAVVKAVSTVVKHHRR